MRRNPTENERGKEREEKDVEEKKRPIDESLSFLDPLQ